MITNTETGTNIHEIADGIYRINTPIDFPDGQGFSFNQYLVVDDDPLLFQTGPRQMFPLVSQAIAAVMLVDRLRYVSFPHVESDECGALNAFLAAAPRAQPLCGQVAAMVSINDLADRPARAMADGERITLGRHTLQWLDTPHVPHGWECGLMMDVSTSTFFCGDLFTQGGAGAAALTESDILGPSEAFRKPLDYFAHAPQTREVLQSLAKHEPMTMAVMHGSAWRGNGAQLLRALRDALSA